jgi:hypothetical protein
VLSTSHPSPWRSDSDNGAVRHSGLEAALTNLTFLLSIFCFLKLLPLDAEVQPYAFIPAGFLVMVYGGALARRYLIFLLGLTIAWCFSALQSAFSNALELQKVTETYVALVIPVTIFVALYGRIHLIRPSILSLSIGIWVMIGFTQTFYPQAQTALGLDKLLAALISRYSHEPLSEIGRGATLLASEPSYSAYILAMFLVSVLALGVSNQLSRRQTLALIFAVAFLAWANRSATVLMLIVFFAAFAVPPRISIVFGAAGVGLLYLLRELDTEFRAISVLFQLADLILGGEYSIIELTNTFGSIRTISVTLGYSRLLDGPMWGTALGSWSTDFLGTMESFGIQPAQIGFFQDSVGHFVNVKPYSHMAIMAFDLGFFGVLLDLVLISPALSLLATSNADSAHRAVARGSMAVGLLCIALNSPVSLPAGWIMVAWGAYLLTVKKPLQTAPA